MKTKSKFYRLNQYIAAPQLRVIDESGKQIGILSRDEALGKARELDVDLIEVVPQAKPPVCRLIDFKKFRYLENKKEQEARKHAKDVETKEIRLSPFISTHDLEIRLKRAREFLKERARLRVVVKFSGRQMTHPEFGQAVLGRFIKGVEELVKIEREPHFEGKLLVTNLLPIKSKK